MSSGVTPSISAIRRFTNVVLQPGVERPHALFGRLDDPAVARLGLGQQSVDAGPGPRCRAS